MTYNKSLFAWVFKSPLWVQVLVLSWGITFMTASAVGYLYATQESEFLNDYLYKRSETTFAAVSSTIIESVITEDAPVLQSIIEALSATLEDIIELKVLNEDGVELAVWKTEERQVALKTLTFQKKITFMEESFGIFELSWDTSADTEKISNHVVKWEIAFISILGGLSTLIIFVFHILAVRHITKINNNLLTLSAGNTEYDLLSVHYASHELINLANSVNQLSQTLKEKYVIEAELTDHRDHLELRVRNQTKVLRTTNDKLVLEVEERKKIEEDLECSLNDLKRSQTMLVQQEKMASLGQLAAGVAHEINNPIGFVSCNLTTLGKYSTYLQNYIQQSIELTAVDLSSTTSEKLEELGRETKLDLILSDLDTLISESLEGSSRVTNIVNTLKEFTHVEAEEPLNCDVSSIVQNSVKIIANELKYSGELVEEYGDNLRILGHPQELSQVFINLIMNGIQAIDGLGIITVRTWSDNANVFISIGDSGVGIPKDVLTSIFDPFFTTKEVGKGTGLGLSICHNIIVKHNGNIKVERSSEAGTVFLITIPQSV